MKVIIVGGVAGGASCAARLRRLDEKAEIVMVERGPCGMELKLSAVRRVLEGESVRAVAQELGIRRKRLYVRKDRYAELGEVGLMHSRGGRPRKVASGAENGSEAMAGRGGWLAARKRIAELERKVPSAAIENLQLSLNRGNSAPN